MDQQLKHSLIDQIMGQVQVFASSWALIGGRFNGGDALEHAEAQRVELRNMVLGAIVARAWPQGQVLVQWIPVGQGLPDSDLTVHITLGPGASEPVWLGYLDGDTWRDIEGNEVEVTHWAQMLEAAA
ncbi:hypothetical protein [Variovorax paradoxus]|uniref:DUF551 domain-containing protein n=1 Tax=Variovorax paradoxus TaxID=34073 RepID=A0A0H2M1U7_VARPD|nr:hypothetical protein [Variovorax paradoxus]KLN54717.1 hypothetical protein VPARA_40210 [Variovorax paradoxus]